jgi:hypothetical protein
VIIILIHGRFSHKFHNNKELSIDKEQLEEQLSDNDSHIQALNYSAKAIKMS